MFYHLALIASLAVFAAGLLYKMSAWFRFSLGGDADQTGAGRRLLAAVNGIAATIFSSKILILAKVFLLDVLLQVRILKEDFLRWLMHMLIFTGFLLLMLIHALDPVVTQTLFSDYYSTLNPFMFLRDLFGTMVLAGVGIALYRRFVLKVPRLKTRAMDHYAIAILMVIVLSGFVLEASKIISYSRYQTMVEEYAGTDDAEELAALESYWVQNYGLVSPEREGPFGDEVLETGQELNENCISCHSRPRWAFGGYAVSRGLKPLAAAMDDAGIPELLWYVHILACFAGLAYLPFSKMFHLIVTPFSLLANAVMDPRRSNPLNIATRQVMELDACTRCATCSLRCSAAAAADCTGNDMVLPAEKMRFLKSDFLGREPAPAALKAIQEGVYLCSNCDRCTVVCPAGINLRELWFNVREALIRSHRPTPLLLTPFSFYRGLRQEELAPERYAAPLSGARSAVTDRYPLARRPDDVLTLTPLDTRFKEAVARSAPAVTFAYCYACENCTTVCPVVGNYDDPQQTLDLLPHQIMRSLGFGLKDLAMGSRMLWDCLTCYQCQEHCPQGVTVTDILFELKNIAVREADLATTQP